MLLRLCGRVDENIAGHICLSVIFSPVFYNYFLLFSFHDSDVMYRCGAFSHFLDPSSRMWLCCRIVRFLRGSSI